MSEQFSNLAMSSGGLMFTAIPNISPDTFALLTYLRCRVDSIEKERHEWLEKLNNIRVKQDVAHKQAWELRTRKTEIDELNR